MDIFFADIQDDNKNSVFLKKSQHKASREILSKILNDFYNVSAPILEDNGKPYLENSEIFFSISHSDKLLTLAFDHKPIGIDIEYLKKRNFVKILNHYNAYNLKSITDIEFYKTWTTLEAEFKSKIFSNIQCFRYKNYIGTISSVDNISPNIYKYNALTNKITKSNSLEFLSRPSLYLVYNYLGMKLKYFERYFTKEILERGKLLFDAECLSYLYKFQNKFYYNVEGTKEYTVIITATDSFDILRCECDCPYAEKNLCKHIAACLYDIRKKVEDKFEF